MNYRAISDEQPLRWCFIGCGAITKSHARALNSIDKSIELSFASRTADKSEAYRRELKGSRAFDTYDSAIKSDDVDVVMINTPPNSHFDLAKKAIEAGKHVVVEKPPFFKSSDFDELGPMADDRKLQLIVAENYYYKPLRVAIRTLLSEKIIGEPRFIHINATKKQEAAKDWRGDKSITGYGALFEGGIHWINFINNLGLSIGEIRGFRPGPVTDLERSIQVVAKTEEGPVISLFYSWEIDTIFKGLRISRIYGTEGSITFETNGIFIWIRGKKKKLKFPGLTNITGQKLMLRDFISALRAGRAPQFDWKMAKEDLCLIETVYSSL